METHLRIISKAFPGKSVGALHDANFSRKRVAEAAKKLQIRLKIEPVKPGSPDGLVFADFANVAEFTGVYWELYNPLIMDRNDLIYQCYRYARKAGKPIVTFHDMLVGSDKFPTKGLMAISDDLHVVGKQAGGMAEKIFAGTSPADIPPEKPASGVITINLYRSCR